MDESTAIDGIARKMDLVVRLLAANLVKGDSPDQQVAILDAAGFLPKEIAEILHRKPVTIRTTLHRMRSRETRKS